MNLKIAPVVVVLFMLSACGSEKTDLLVECPSPDGNKIATLYRVSSGDGDVNRETRLNVRPAASPMDSSMFSFSMRHGHDAIIRWITNDRLELTYPLDAILTHQENVIFGSSQTFSSSDQVRVSYIEKPSTHGYFVVEKRCFNQAHE